LQLLSCCKAIAADKSTAFACPATDSQFIFDFFFHAATSMLQKTLVDNCLLQISPAFHLVAVAILLLTVVDTPSVLPIHSIAVLLYSYSWCQCHWFVTTAS